jgi:GT2 family glycosyltransferase
LIQPTVAIVILNYNGRNYFQQFLPSVVESSYLNKRIIVADNASTDDSVDVVRQNFPSIEIILLDKNYGYAEGYNRALQQVRSDYYVLLNSDVEVTSGWIEPVITLMETGKEIAACQPKILSYHQKNTFEYAGAAGGWIDSLGYPFSKGRVFDDCEHDKGQYDSNSIIFWATGAALFVRAMVFHEAGGFDNFFFAHMEEIDLCWRMQLKGYKVMCCPASVVYHVGGGTLPKGNSRKVFLNFRNNLIMLHKNMCWREKVWKLPIRLLFDLLFAFKSLVSGYGPSFMAVMKAYAALVRWIFSKSANRALKKQCLREMNGVYKGSIIIEYFLLKKKSFSQIVKKNF